MVYIYFQHTELSHGLERYQPLPCLDDDSADVFIATQASVEDDTKIANIALS